MYSELRAWLLGLELEYFAMIGLELKYCALIGLEF